MDPSYSLSLVKPTKNFNKYDNAFSTPKIQPVIDYVNNTNSLIDYKLLNNITELLPILRNTDELQKQLNQFSRIHSNKFKTYDAIKMANLDALTNISEHLHGLLVPKTYDYNIDIEQKYETVVGNVSFESLETRNPIPRYCILYGAPGGFVEYLEWRIPKIYGYGITNRNNDWNLKLIRDVDPNTLSGFERIYGDSGSGNIRDHGLDFIVTLQEKSPNGLDFIIANGDFAGYDLYMEITIAILTVKARGNILIKLNDTWSKTITDLIYIISLIFEKIEIIKPVISNPATSERYLCCQSRRDNIDDLTELLNLFIDTEHEIFGLFEELPKNFTIWLTKINNTLAKYQLQFLQNIIKAGNNETVVLEKIDLSRSLIIWGIPE